MTLQALLEVSESSLSCDELKDFVKNDDRSRANKYQNPVVCGECDSVENSFEEGNVQDHAMESHGTSDGSQEPRVSKNTNL